MHMNHDDEETECPLLISWLENGPFKSERASARAHFKESARADTQKELRVRKNERARDEYHHLSFKCPPYRLHLDLEFACRSRHTVKCIDCVTILPIHKAKVIQSNPVYIVK